jgi:hypothetical protein
MTIVEPEAATAPPTPTDQRPHSATAQPITRVVVEERTLDTGADILHEQDRGTLRITFDPAQTTAAVVRAFVGIIYGRSILALFEPEPMARVRSVRLGEGTPAAIRDTINVLDLAIDFSHSPEEITAALQCLLEEAIETRRWIRRQPPAHAMTADQLADAAERLAVEAVRASTAGSQTNHRSVAARLHAAVDRAQAAHLMDVVPERYTADTAYSNERFGTAHTAMEEALRYSENRQQCARGLASLLEGLAREAGAPMPAPAVDYTPPTDWDDAEAITCTGERGAILKAYLLTPMWEGAPDGPTRLSVFTEPSSEGELDAAGATKLIADLETLLPRLRAMRDVLVAQDGQ